MSERHVEMRDLVEVVAKAIYESTFVDRYDGLPDNGIDKALARQAAIAALNAVADYGDTHFPVHRGLAEQDTAA